eukprot:s1026_g3.t1
MHGRCTTLESCKEMEKDVQKYLMSSSKSLFIDFQGEMMGHGGEIYFAVIKTVPLLFDTVEDSANVTDTGPGFILDLQCKAKVDLLRDILKNPEMLKAAVFAQAAPPVCTAETIETETRGAPSEMTADPEEAKLLNFVAERQGPSAGGGPGREKTSRLWRPQRAHQHSAGGVDGRMKDC